MPEIASPDAASTADVSSLKLTYDPIEDRIRATFVLAAGEAIEMWFSRRLTRMLLRHLADLIERTSRSSKRATGADRETVLAFEHEAAVKTVARLQQGSARPSTKAANDGRPEAPEPVPQGICTTVDATVRRGICHLTFRAQQGPGLRLKTSRPLAHWLIDVLSRNAATGDWNLGSPTSWLLPDKAPRLAKN